MIHIIFITIAFTNDTMYPSMSSLSRAVLARSPSSSSSSSRRDVRARLASCPPTPRPPASPTTTRAPRASSAPPPANSSFATARRRRRRTRRRSTRPGRPRVQNHNHIVSTAPWTRETSTRATDGDVGIIDVALCDAECGRRVAACAENGEISFWDVEARALDALAVAPSRDGSTAARARVRLPLRRGVDLFYWPRRVMTESCGL